MLVALVLFIAPLLPLVGLQPVAFHVAAAAVAIPALRPLRRLKLRASDLLLLAFIAAYALSLGAAVLRHAPTDRVIGSAYNLTLWAVGLGLLVAFANRTKIPSRLILRGGYALFWCACLFGLLPLAAWLRGVRVMHLHVLPRTNVAGELLEASLRLDVLRPDWTLNHLVPRTAGFSLYPTAFAAILVLSGILALLARQTGAVRKRRIDVLLVPLFVLGLLLTSSRGAVLGLGPVFATALVFAPKIVSFADKRARLVAFRVAAGILSVFFLAVGGFLITSDIIGIGPRPGPSAGEAKPAIEAAAAAPAPAPTTLTTRAASTHTRMDLYKQTIDQWIQRPLTGIGIKPRTDNLDVPPIGSHSTYLGVLLRTGALGLCLLLAFFVVMLWESFTGLRRGRTLGERRAHAAAFAALAFAGPWMIGDDLDAPQLVTFLFFLLLALPRLAARKPDDAKPAPSPFERSDVCGIPLVRWTQDEIVDHVARTAQSDAKTTVFGVYAHCVNIATDDDEYMTVLNDSRAVPHADGMGVVWATRVLGRAVPERCATTDMFPEICRRAAERGISVFFLGAREGVAMRCAARMRSLYRGLNVAGAAHGFFDDDAAIVREINASAADIVFVGLGMPKQEKWVAANRQAINASVVITCGASLDFYAGDIARAPQWMQRAGLEWLHRLLLDPPRLWRRYVVGNPLFALRVARYWWSIERRERARRAPRPAKAARPAYSFGGRRVSRRAAVGVAVAGGVAFAGALAVGAVPVAASARAAERSLRVARSEAFGGNRETAAVKFAEAETHFASARRAIDRSPVLSAMARVPIAGWWVTSVRQLAEGGRSVARAGSLTTDWWARVEGAWRGAGSGIDLAVMSAGADELRPIQAVLDDAHKTVRPAPFPLNGFANEYLREVDSARRQLAVAQEAMHLAASMLGGDRRYFVAAQTPSELRGTGGLLGGYGIVQASSGRLDIERFGSIWDLPTPASVGVSAPGWFQSRYGQFGAAADWRNVNMTPDFPTVARVVVDTVERTPSMGTVDGVIAIDPVALSALLSLSGPVDVEGWPEPITKDNVVEIVGNRMYERYDGRAVKDQRVDFLGAATRAAFTALFSSKPQLNRTTLEALGAVALGKHLQIYSTNPSEQRRLADLGVDGAFQSDGPAVFSVISQNASGTKADYYMRRDVRYDIELQPGGEARVRVTTKVVNGAPSKGAPHYVIGPFIAGDAAGWNRNYLSVYAPLASSFAGLRTGAETISSEIEQEGNNSVYTSFIKLAPESHETMIVDLWTRGVVSERDGKPVLDLLFRGQPTMFPDSITVSVAGGSWDVAPDELGADRDGDAWVWTKTGGRDFRVRADLRKRT